MCRKCGWCWICHNEAERRMRRTHDQDDDRTKWVRMTAEVLIKNTTLQSAVRTRTAEISSERKTWITDKIQRCNSLCITTLYVNWLLTWISRVSIMSFSLIKDRWWKTKMKTYCQFWIFVCTIPFWEWHFCCCFCCSWQEKKRVIKKKTI